MRYIKFNTQQEAQDVADRVFTAANADGKFVQGTTAYAVPEKEEYFTIPILEGFDNYFTNAELSGVEAFAEEKQSRTIIDDIYHELKTQNLTPTQIDTMINTLLRTMVLLLAGYLRPARVACNNTATTALFTAQRKTWLLNRIDEEIAKF